MKRIRLARVRRAKRVIAGGETRRARASRTIESEKGALRRWALWLALLSLSFGGPARGLAQPVPLPLSPGSRDAFVAVDGPCPTFSWTTIREARHYEVIAYEIAATEGVSLDFELGDPEEPALRVEMPPGAGSWTPSRERCFENGGRYGWLIGTEGEDGTRWSEPLFFQVAARRTTDEVAAALEVLRRYLERGGELGPGALALPPPEAERTSADSVRTAARGETGPLASAVAALHAAIEDQSGVAVGVVGTTASPEGAGVAAANEAVEGGADLLLDGAAQSVTDTTLSESGIDRSSPDPEVFAITNSGGGGIALVVDGAPVGDVTSVSPGQGLAGGGTIGDVGVEVATGGITTALLAEDAVTSAKVLDQSLTADDLAPGSVGASEIDETQVQTRVTGLCEVGQALVGVNADGSAICQQLALAPRSLVLATSNLGAGSNGAGVFGADGFPIFSYFQAEGEELQVVKCNDPDCTGENETIHTVDGPGVGASTSIAIGADGFPVISYVDFSFLELEVAKCNDAACAGNDEETTTFGPADYSVPTSIAIGGDGLPVLAYTDLSPSVIVVKCNDAACAGADETTTTLEDGVAMSLAIGADSLPILSYTFPDPVSGQKTLKVAKCDDHACSGGGETLSVVDADPDHFVGSPSALAIGADGLPVLAYERRNDSGDHLAVAKCNDLACSGEDETITLLRQTPVDSVAIAIGPGGLPMIAYHDGSNLRFVRCNDVACTGADEAFALVEEGGDVGEDVTLLVAADGLPLMGYLRKSPSPAALKVAKCPTLSCF